MRLLMTYPQMQNPTANFFQDMDRWFEQASGPTLFSPPVDVQESEEAYRLSFDLPGLTKDQIQIDLNDRKLIVSGERKQIADADTKLNSTRTERPFGAFSRTFTLPGSIDTNAVEAVFENGVLELTLKKSQASRPRRIEVKAGSAH